MGQVLRLHRNHDSGIGPLGIARGVGHSVQHQFPRLRGGRDQYAARTHTEGKDSPALYLGDESVLGRRHERLPLAVVLYLVYEPLRMLDADSEREALCLDGPAAAYEEAINVPRRMAAGEYDLAGGETAARRLQFIGSVCLANYVFDAAAKVIFAAMADYAFTYIFDYLRQLVAAYMRMRAYQYVRIGAELHELVQHFAYIPPLRRTGEKLAVREGAGTAFAETVVAVGIDEAFAGQAGDVELARVDVLASFEYDRLISPCEQLEGREHSRRAGAYDEYGFGRRDVEIGLSHIFLEVFSLAHHGHPVTVERLLAGIDAAAHDTPLPHHLRLAAQGLGGQRKHVLVQQFPAYLFGYLYFFHILRSSGYSVRHSVRYAGERGHVERAALAIEVMEPAGYGYHRGVVRSELELR